MKLGVVAASLSLSGLLAGLAGCATATDDLGYGGAYDSSTAPVDAAHDGSGNDGGNDSGTTPKDTGGTPKDSGSTTVDSGTTGTDTGSGDDTAVADDTGSGTDSDLPDTAVDDTGVPPGDGGTGTCAVDTDCTFPYNCCDLTTNTCSVLFVFICLPNS